MSSRGISVKGSATSCLGLVFFGAGVNTDDGFTGVLVCFCTPKVYELTGLTGDCWLFLTCSVFIFVI